MTQPSDMSRNRTTIDAAWIRERVEDFVSRSRENTLGFDHPKKVFNMPLVGFAAETDRLWQVYRDHIGAFYENIEIVAELQSGQEAVTFIRDSKPEVALIDTNLSDINGFDLTELIRREYPFTQVIIVSQDKYYDTVLKSMRIGAADFITHDVKLDELNIAIKRAYDLAQERYTKATPSFVAETIPLQPTVPSTPTKLGSIITVYSPKGGSGTTTVAINLALALQSAEATVAIADSSMQYGDVAVLLNEVGKFSMHDLVPSIHELDTGLIDDVLLLHKSTGLKLLAAPPTPGY